MLKSLDVFRTRMPSVRVFTYPLACNYGPALGGVSTHHAIFFAAESRTLRALVWQPHLPTVVQYSSDGFHVGAWILSVGVGVPANQPHLADMM